MSHAVSDAVMDLRVCPDSLHFRLGVQFRIPDQAPPSLESLLPARYLRIQVASPPPRRIDGSRWQDGLRVRDGTKNGREFDADDPTWKKSGVFPLEGISPLINRRRTRLSSTGGSLFPRYRQRRRSRPPSSWRIRAQATTSSPCTIRRRSLTARSWRWRASTTTVRECSLTGEAKRSGLPSASPGSSRANGQAPTTSSPSKPAPSPLSGASQVPWKINPWW